MRNVALIGAQGTGKSTLAKALCGNLGYRQLGISDAVKRVTALAYRDLGKQDQLTVNTYAGPVAMSGREALQGIGAALRSFDREYWLRVWQQGFNDLYRLGCKVVVDDVRLPEEVEWLRRADPSFRVILLRADPEVRARRVGGAILGGTDVTETGWESSGYDLSIDTSVMEPDRVYTALWGYLKGGNR